MIVLDGMLLLGLSALLTAVATVIWAVRRKP